MTLAPGARLGPYEITAKLGEGGMGVVFKAKDSHLGREVALKVLPEGFTRDPERLARFEREAKLLASLNHPHIAQVYGLEVAGDARALVMELVEGPTLAERLEKGALPLEESLSIARQIAEALEEAHEKGIVHRDLKPQNIKASIEGKVKVLDFGLAKALDPPGSSAALPADLAHSPTITFGGTLEGVILGTAAYMAPEQARGGAVDKRADIWAFGVVLYEMLAGERLFAEQSVVDTLSAVMRKEIDLGKLPAAIPQRLRELVRRCLERDPKRRLRDIGEARLLLEETVGAAGWEPRLGGAGPASPVTPVPARTGRHTWPAIAAGIAIVAAGVGFILQRAPNAKRAVAVVAALPPPPGYSYYLHSLAPGPATLTRDGTRMAFTAVDADSVVRIFVREMATGAQRVLPGTESAQYPFWSEDGQWIGYFSQRDQNLRKIPAAGGASTTICRADGGKGGTWNRDGVILFAPSSGAPIHRVSADGGESTPVTELDGARFNSHRLPRFLPDGRSFLYFARSPDPTRSRVMVASLAGGEPRELVVSTAQAEYAAGHLLFEREGTLLAQPFDAGELVLSGSPVTVAENVAVVPGVGLALFSVAESGPLVLHRGALEAPVQLELRDRAGQLLGRLAAPSSGFRDMEFSPDGRSVAFARTDRPQDLFLLDLARGSETRFSLDDAEEVWPLWSADGTTLFYAANPRGPHDIYRKTIAGTGSEELLVDPPVPAVPVAVSPDGRTLLYIQYLPDARELWRFDLASGRSERLLDRVVFATRAAFSPDGRWIAFVALEAGRPQVFAAPFPGPGRIFPVSRDGGLIPHWPASGGEILYLDLLGTVVSVPAEASAATLELGPPTALFHALPPSSGSKNFAVSPDGSRFLLARDGTFGATNELVVLSDWTSRLPRR